MFIIKLRRFLFKLKILLIIFIILIIFISSIFIIQFEKHFVPTATLIGEKYAINVISTKINESFLEVISNIDIDNLDFFQTYYNNNTNYINTNSTLINYICSQISNSLSDKLSNIKESKVSLPLGNLTGIGFLSNFGPSINIYISSVGNATVDYETKFENVGINQLNLQVWLNINTQITIISNLYTKDINVKRTLMLINVVFNGDVPNSYFDLSNYSPNNDSNNYFDENIVNYLND